MVKIRGYMPLAAGGDEFDRIHGTDTGGLTPLWFMKIGSENAVYGQRYEATSDWELIESIRHLSEDLSGFVFIDLGCGKGRTIMVASSLGFQTAVGVEFARKLVNTARDNLTKVGLKNAEIVLADAADFQFPDASVVLYLYNPFTEKVMRQVVENLSLRRMNKLYVIYKGPICADLLDSSGFLRRFGSSPKAPHILIWQSIGERETRNQFL